MTRLQSLNLELTRERLARRDTCTCGHERHSHMEWRASCVECQCCSFRAVKETK